MPSDKLSNLQAAVNPTLAALLYAVLDPSGTPTDVKLTIQQVLTLLKTSGLVSVPAGSSEGDGLIKGPGNDFILLKNNLTAIVAPTVDDDSNAGYAVKSLWMDITNSKVYQCSNASVGAADWIDLTGGGAVEWTELQRETIIPVAQTVDFLDKLTDDYNVYRLKYLNLESSVDNVSMGVQVGTGTSGSPVWVTSGYLSRAEVSASPSTTYFGGVGNQQNMTFGHGIAADAQLSGELVMFNLRSASYAVHGFFNGVYTVLSQPRIHMMNGGAGLGVVGGPYTQLRADINGSSGYSGGILVLEGGNL